MNSRLQELNVTQSNQTFDYPNGMSFQNRVEERNMAQDSLHYQVAINKQSMRQGVITQRYKQRQALFMNKYD